MKKKKANAVQKQPYMCEDGPWMGRVLYLSTSSTLRIKVNGTIGRYVLDCNKLRWETIDEGNNSGQT